MFNITCDKSNLASVLLGKDTYLPWRGQRNVIIEIPYVEWLSFIKENREVLKYRRPLNYDLILNETNPNREYKFFMFDCSWALYNEVMCSANLGLDATIILPKFDTNNIKTRSEIIEFAKCFTDEEYNKNYGIMARAIPYAPQIPDGFLSDWNHNMLLLSVYLQSKLNDGLFERFNIDWR